jgi:hypothetical protein
LSDDNGRTNMPKTLTWTGWVPQWRTAELVKQIRVRLWEPYSHGLHDGAYHGIISECFCAADALSRLRKDLLPDEQKTARKVTVTVTVD